MDANISYFYCHNVNGPLLFSLSTLQNKDDVKCMFVAVLSSGDFSFSGESKGMSVGGSQTSSETGKILSFTS